MKEFDRIIGYESVKKDLMRISDSLRNAQVYQALGVRAGRGLMLCGDPGVGKTLMANCLIEASGRPAFVCRKDQADGEFVDTIRTTFEKASHAAPSIVLLDDLDKFANGDESHRNSEEYVAVQSCIDEVKDLDVFIVATVNEEDLLPRSLKRSGRFDRVIQIDSPETDDAKTIIRYYLQKLVYVGDLDTMCIAEIMKGHSCADLETVINEAGIYAGYERSDRIGMDHFLRAYLRIFHHIDPESLNQQGMGPLLEYDPDDRSLVIFHEAGHAVVSEVLSPGSVKLACIYGVRRNNFEGFVTAYPNEDDMCTGDWNRYTALKSLGGKASVDLKYGIVDRGAKGDIRKVYSAIEEMITDDAAMGFSLLTDTLSARSCADPFRMKIQEIIAAEMERYYHLVKEILVRNREFLERTAQALSEKSVLLSSDIRKIRESCTIRPASDM